MEFPILIPSIVDVPDGRYILRGITLFPILRFEQIGRMSQPSASLPQFPGGEYEIQDVVGRGGMSVVYRARDLRRPRDVAIKVLRPEVAQSIGTTRFLREIAVAASFSHPHILPLIDSGELKDDQGRATPFYVMPLVEGETLHQRLMRDGPLPLPVVMRITREILEALQYAHAKGVIHRDIKPANILLSDGQAVVADFGVSRPLPTATEEGEPALTMTGDIVGTPMYMSPEQALGNHVVDARSDIFSVGCVMYEMIAGDRPFDTPIPQYTNTRRRHGIFEPISSVRPDVPPALDDILATALQADPGNRYASAAAFLHALAGVQLQESSGWGALHRLPPDWLRKWTVAGLAVAAIVAAVAVGGRGANASNNPTANMAPGSDKTRVAVLSIEPLMPDSLLTIVANGFQTDLIDELAQYPALSVISKNGVMRFRSGNTPSDSIARVLNVGSVVTGDIRRVGDSVRVAVRLIDGATGMVRSTASAAGALSELLSVRSAVITSVTNFLRTVIGNEITAGERSIVRSAEAWELRARVINMSEPAQGLSLSLTPAEREARFQRTDSILVRAAKLDTRWSAPLAASASLHLSRAIIEDQVQSVPGGARDATRTPRQFRLIAMDRVNAALQRSPNDPVALYVRGRAQLDLWQFTKGPAVDSLRIGAEADLRKAIAARVDMGNAWNQLSMLYQSNGENDLSRKAADSALKSDAFLRSAPAIINRLMITSLASGQVDEARANCARGRAEYPERPEFWGCELTILGWVAHNREDVGTAWRKLAEAEARDTLNILQSGKATRRLFIAAIAARAGLRDSATAIVRRVRDDIPVGHISPNADYGEAYVQTLLGNHREALLLLDRYLAGNAAFLPQVRRTPWFAALHSDTAFLRMTAPPVVR